MTNSDDDEVHKTISESLRREHGNVVRIQSHEPPRWFDHGWLVSFELPKRPGEESSATRVAFFRNENEACVGEGNRREG